MNSILDITDIFPGRPLKLSEKKKVIDRENIKELKIEMTDGPTIHHFMCRQIT